MHEKPSQRLPYALLQGKLKKLIHFRCEECGEPDDPTVNRPLRLVFLDGNYTNRDRSNLNILCPRCIRRRDRMFRTARRRRYLQHSMFPKP